MPDHKRIALPSPRLALEDLFISQLRALPDHHSRPVRENFLTACFAGAMAASLTLRRRVVRLLVGQPVWRGHQVSKADILVKSQMTHRNRASGADSNCYVDLVLEVNRSQRIGVEVKLEASEGVDTDGRRQLDRYLALEHLDAVAYLTANDTVVVDHVWKLRNRAKQYLVPRELKNGSVLRRHFLWADLYPDVEALTRGRHAEPLVIAFRKLLEYLQLRPVHPWVGELGGRQSWADVSPAIRSNRERMQGRMREVQSLLIERGWTTTAKGPRNNGTLYLWREDRRGKSLRRIQASSNLTPGTFRLWIEVESPRALRILITKLIDAVQLKLQGTFGRDLFPMLLEPRGHKYAAVDVRIPFKTLLSGVKSPLGVGRRLAVATSLVADTALRLLDD